MPVIPRDFRSRLYDLLYLRIPGLQADPRVGQAVLTRAGFGPWVGHIPAAVSAAAWCDQALEVFVEAYPTDTCQQLDRFLDALATIPMLGLYEPSPDDLREIQACRDEIGRLTCEELCRQLAPARYAVAATAPQVDLAALLAAARAQLAAEMAAAGASRAAAPTAGAALAVTIPTPGRVFARLDLKDQVRAFTETYPDYASGGIYQCIMSGDDTVVADWLVPRLIAELKLEDKRVKPKRLWLAKEDLPASDAAPVFQVINKKATSELRPGFTELVRPGRGPALVLIRTTDNSITADMLRKLACRCCEDTDFQKLAEQARRNAVLLVVGWVGTGVIEPLAARQAGLCAIPVGNMDWSEVLPELRTCLENSGVPATEVNEIIDRWTDEVSVAPVRPAKLIYEATIEALGGR